MPEGDPYLVPLDPATKVRVIAQQSNVPADVADDYLKLTKVESSQNVNVRNSAKGARGFGQVMPDVPGGKIRTVGGKQYDLTDPSQNIEAGLKYFHEGGSDPVARRLHYFGGPKASSHYQKTGKIPNISDGNMTASEYVKATGGQADDPYLAPLPGKGGTQVSDADPYLAPIPVTRSITKSRTIVSTKVDPQFGKDTSAPIRTLAGTTTRPMVPRVPNAKPGPYATQLPADQEAAFQQWVQQNKVPWQDTPDADYDMRGYYKALQSGDQNAKQKLSGFDGSMHFPDTYKTPYHKTFSNESQYALPSAPHWEGERLVDAKGNVIVDETPKSRAPKVSRGGDELARQLGMPSTSRPLPPSAAPPATMDTVREGLGLQPNATRELGERAAAITEAKAPLRQSVGLQVTKERNPQTFREGLARGPEVIAEKLNPFNWGKTEAEKVGEETERRVAASERAQSPEMIERRKGRGAMSAAARAVDDPSARALAGLGHMAAGVMDLGGILRKIDPAGETDQGWTPLGISNYLHKRAQVLEESTTNAPLTAEGQEIERGFKEKLGASVGDLGLGIAQIVALKKATGLPLGRLLAIEAGLKTSNETMAERAPKITESYVLGRALEGHLGRLQSAWLFAAPTAIGVAPGVLRGTMPLSDAALQVGVQAAAGGILGGSHMAEESQVRTGGQSPSTGIEGETVPAIEPVHHSEFQTRDAGQFGPMDLDKLVPQEGKRSPKEGEPFIDGHGVRRIATHDYQVGEYQILGRPAAESSTLPTVDTQAVSPALVQKTPVLSTSDVNTDTQEVVPEIAPKEPILTSPDSPLRQYNVNGKLFTENADQSTAQGNVILVTAEDGTKGWVRASEPPVGTVAHVDVQSSETKGAQPNEATEVSKTPATTTTSAEVGEQSPASEPSTGKEKERSFPKTLEASGREGGTDRTYDEFTDKESRDRADARIAKDREAAARYVLGSSEAPETSAGKERIATGLKLADQLATEAESTTDPTEKAAKHAQALQLYDKLSQDLTTAGQTVQAASQAKKYSVTGAPLEVVRIAKTQSATPKAEDISIAREMARKHSDLEGRLADVQKQIDDLRAQKASKPESESPKPTAPKTERTKVATLKDRLAQMEAEGRAELAQRAKNAQMEAQKAGPKGQRGAGVNPASLAADIASWTKIGAAKIGMGGLNFASWSAEMIKDFGDDIRPHLNKVFLAAHKLVGEQRAALKEDSALRSATKELGKRGQQVTPRTLEDLQQEKYRIQIEKRQQRADMDRKFKELEKRTQRGPVQKTRDAVASVLTSSLLSYHGLLNILSTMSAKEAINTALRVPEAGLDVTYRSIRRVGGTQVPRASSGLSVKGLTGATKSFVTEGPGNVAKAFMGKSSEVMPRVHEGAFDNPAANLALDFMVRHYAAKEALVRSAAYPLERQNQASILARNDVLDGTIPKSELNKRIDDYLNGRASIDGPLARKYAQSLAEQAADYEIKSGNPTESGKITPSAKAARVRTMVDNPTQLIDSQALQYADKESYGNPLGPKMQKAQDALNAGGPIPRTLIQPFFKRPVNAFNDFFYNYTGARAGREGVRAAIRGMQGMEWTPAERQSFNQATARGGTVYGLFALGSALAAHGLLTSQNDPDHPGSLKVGKSYYAIGNKPVIGWAIVAGATAKLDGAKAVPGAIGHMIMEHPLLRGLKNVSDVADAGVKALKGDTKAAKKGLIRFAGKTISRGVPTLSAATAETMDTQNRDTSSLFGPTKARLPFLRKTLPSTGPKERGSAFDPFIASPLLKPRHSVKLDF